MKFRVKTRSEDTNDNFHRVLKEADWTFKFCTWIILIGTLRYATELTGNRIYSGVAFGLVIQICFIAHAFITSRIVMEIVSAEGGKTVFRNFVNTIIVALIGFAAWEIAYYTVTSGVSEIVEFHKRSH